MDSNHYLNQYVSKETMDALLAGSSETTVDTVALKMKGILEGTRESKHSTSYLASLLERLVWDESKGYYPQLKQSYNEQNIVPPIRISKGCSYQPHDIETIISGVPQDPISYEGFSFAAIPFCILTKHWRNVDVFTLRYEENFYHGTSKVHRKWTVTTLGQHQGVKMLFLYNELMLLWYEQGLSNSRIFIGDIDSIVKRFSLNPNLMGRIWVERHLISLMNTTFTIDDKIDDNGIITTNTRICKPFVGLMNYSGKNPFKMVPLEYCYIILNKLFVNNYHKNNEHLYRFSNEYLTSIKNYHARKLAFFLCYIFNPDVGGEASERVFSVDNMVQRLQITGSPFSQERMLKRACSQLMDRRFPLLENYEIVGEQIIFYKRSNVPINCENSKKSLRSVNLIMYTQNKALYSPDHQIFRESLLIIAQEVPDDIIYKALTEVLSFDSIERRKHYMTLIIKYGYRYLRKAARQLVDDHPFRQLVENFSKDDKE